MEKYGFELYAGDWIAIREACRAELIDELRSGRFSESVLLFPPEFGAGDILFLQDAVARLTGSPVIELDFERDEPSGCMFADRLIAEWVSSVASVSPADGSVLMQYWSERYFTEELPEPAWHKHVAGTLGNNMIELCRLSMVRSLDVVMIWIL